MAKTQSKRVLVYDCAQSKTWTMSRSKFNKKYLGEESWSIPIPKGASRIDVSPDDLTPPSSVESSAETLAVAERQRSHHINESYTASVHIPSKVFWVRALISPSMFPELTVVSPCSTPNTSPDDSPNSSQNNSRSNTSRTNTSA